MISKKAKKNIPERLGFREYSFYLQAPMAHRIRGSG
jgi:hypothetical protein